MTATTHQMIALLAALWFLTANPVSLGPGLALLAVIAVMSGALTPDLDQPTATVWRRMLGSNHVGNIFNAFSGGHRHFTHSFLGIFMVGWILHWLATHIISPDYQTSALVLWRAFMIGYISHPIADTLTDRGVPWFWPYHWHIRIPPGPEEVRVTTGSFVENILVRATVIIAAVLLIQSNWPTLRDFF